MAFAPKVDRCGVVAALTVGSASPISTRTANLGGSSKKYQPSGQYGDLLGTEVYGEVCSATNSYAVKKGGIAHTAGTLKLNHVTVDTVGTGPTAVSRSFALDSISIGTAAGSAVTMDASATQIEGATTTDADQDLYPIPAFALSTKQCAQDIFGAFTLSGEGCELTKCDAKITCKVGVDEIEGTLISSDCADGVITVSGTILSRLGNAPTVTASTASVPLGNGLTSTWTLTQPAAPTETNPEAAAKEYTFELELTLKRTRSEEESSSSS